MKLPFQLDLSGKTVVITGGSGVLGASFAKALAACGAKVAILARKKESAQELLNEIEGEAAFFQADVTNIESLKQARDEVISKYGKPTILINGAGGNNPKATTEDEFYNPDAQMKDFFQLDLDALKMVFDLNFHGALLASQVFAKDLIGQEGASIINISSMNAYRPLTKIPAYSGAKAAVQNLTMWLATYFAGTGLRVNAIAPGFFVSHQNRDLLFDKEGKPTPRTGKILRATPMGRFGEADELLGTLFYLISPQASSFVTGVVIPVDGGFSAYSGV
ncbi:MAG: SDR family oxidoreductase [Clostridiales bacterium]|jgi:NAD(P)-dependent dehydrogenase (short-subunit alcohol dehydrogenase family)|nr:SDR family oxidoreductase [Clostridiales bacterium]